MQSNQRASEPIAHITHLLIFQLVLQLDRKPIRLPLKVSTDGVHPDAYDRLKRGQDHLEEQEGDDGRRLGGNFLGEIEGAEDRRGVKEGGEQGEDGEDVDLRDGEEFGGVEVVPVAELVCYGF